MEIEGRQTVTGSGAWSATLQVNLRGSGEQIPYSRKLLALSKSLIDAGEFSIAVVVAHVACEVATDRAFNRLYVMKKLKYLERPIGKLLPSKNLENSKIRQLYTALSNDSIEKERFWQQFTRSVTRRNRVSHRGEVVAEFDAKASLDAATQLVEHLDIALTRLSNELL